MRTPSEAIAEILGRMGPPLGAERVSITQASGRVLAEGVVSDVDLPPFEKSMMDGFAVHSEDFGGADAGAAVRLACVGESRAGAPFGGEVPRGSCAEIYTGAELPAGCDAVVMVERSRREGDAVLLEGPVRPDQHVSHRGEILAVGREVLAAGRRLSPSDLAVLAAVGCDPVPVVRRPRVSILTTGDELVPASEVPGPGQIREGNTLYLAAAAERVGAEVLRAGIVPDDESEMERAFGAALEVGDVLVTTGGVSMGKYDLVGQVLERLGVEPVLHKVAIKPGKPIWFGMRGETPVFGLPGNPVSAMLGFEVFVRPALAALSGADAAERAERLRRGRWMGPPPRVGDRQQNLPARLACAADGGTELWPLPWKGSADIVGLAAAQALAVIPAGAEVATGQVVDYRPLEHLHTREAFEAPGEPGA